MRNSVTAVSIASRARVSAWRWRSHTQPSGSKAPTAASSSRRRVGLKSTAAVIAQRPARSHEEEARITRSMSRFTLAGSKLTGNRIIHSPIGSIR